MATKGLSPTVSKINGDFSENRKFFQPHVFNAPAEGIPLKFDNGA